MRFLVAGGSGFLGSHLIERLRAEGHQVTRLVRREASAPYESTWQPDRGEIDVGAVEAADVVVNLAGSPTAGNPHSRTWARRLRESRVTTTRLLAETIAATAPTGGGTVYLAGNGISYYGDHGDDVVTEDADSRGDALLTSVAREWQAATEPAAEAGSRVCVLRTAPVMDADAPPLRQQALLTRFGGAARLGSGRQHDPMISLRDWVSAAVHLAGDEGASGPFNLCCPETPTNAEFTEALARMQGRRAFLKVPSALIGAGAGRLGPELLGSTNARPQKLLDRGFTFTDPDVTAVVAAGLRRARR